MRHLRISVATIVCVLICIGIVMIFSASGVHALQERGDSSFFLRRHLLFLFAGFIAMLAAMSFDYREMQKYVKPALLIIIVALVCVLIPGIGKQVSGARRWFRIAGYSFQPSEAAKLIMILYVADFLSRKQNRLRNFTQGFLPVMAVTGLVCLLILRQPDLGTMVSIGIIVIIMLYIAGVRFLYLGFLFLGALPVLYFLIWKVPYRLVRIMAFIDPWQDAKGIGFQLSQSQIALGSGGLFGVGLGKSMQKLFYLPAAHTDFIFSIIGEELGLAGTLTVIFLFGCFIWQGARIAKRTENPFGYFLAVGIVTMIAMQAVVNIGVSMGALPTKGLPLPFISYGGSALIVNMFAVGLLLNVSRIEEL